MQSKMLDTRDGAEKVDQTTWYNLKGLFSKPAMSKQLRMMISAQCGGGALRFVVSVRLGCVCGLHCLKIATVWTKAIEPRCPTWAVDFSEPAMSNRLWMVISV